MAVGVCWSLELVRLVLRLRYVAGEVAALGVVGGFRWWFGWSFGGLEVVWAVLTLFLFCFSFLFC